VKRKSNKQGPGARNRPATQGPAASSNPADPATAGWPFGVTREWQAILLCLFVFLVVFQVFYPITHGGFVNYDDDVYVTDNFHVQGGLALEQVAWAFGNTDAANWHPLTWLSHMLDCQLYGAKPWGHHLTSVLIHALNAALLFVVLRGMTGALWRSLFVALLFGLHPLRVESVAWIAERKDVLSALFWLLTLWAYARYAEVQSREAGGGGQLSVISDQSSVISGKNEATRPAPHVSRFTFHVSRYYALSLLFFALGLMSKPMVVTLPFVLLLLDYWPLGRMKRGNLPRLAWEKAPFFLLAAAGSAITFLAQKSQGAVIDYLPFINRAENGALAYVRYLGKFLCPVNLAVLYPHPVTWPLAKIIAATGLLIALSAAVVLVRRSRPYCVLGWLWFLGTLVPVIGLVQVGSQSLADRYTYIPGIGLSIILTWGAWDLARRLPGKRTALAAATAVIIGCAALTRHQIGFWKDGGALFSHAVAVTENSYQARKALGDFYWSQGRVNEALALYREAIQMRPGFEGAHLNLGAVLNQTGHVAEAIDEFKQAIQLKPDDPSACNDLGAVLGAGHLDESIRLFQRAIELDPNYADAHKNLGQALDQTGQLEKAVIQYQKVIRLKPSAAAHYLLAADLEKLGRKDEAILHYTEALKIQPDDAKAQRALARLRP
jgi:tetratricopeptide (TPR) repeat protein